MVYIDDMDSDELEANDLLTEDNPIEGYVDLKRFQDRADRTVASLDNAIHENEDGTALGQYFERNGIDPLEAEIPDIYGYKNFLESCGNKDRDIQNKLSESSAMYNTLMTMGIADMNPVAFVLKESDLDIDPPDRPQVTVDFLGDFLSWIPDPEFRAIGTLLAKEGIHNGETVNTDLHTLHLDHPQYYALLDRLGITLHDEVSDQPDSLYIPADISAGEVVRGDERYSGNKRSRDTVLPIGPELKYVLLQWLAVRPLLGEDEPHPLFTSVTPQNGSYRRIRPYQLHNKLIDEFGVEFGLCSGPGERNQAGVDVQFFRHFWTTQLTEAHGDHDDYLKPNLRRYLRGDTMEDATLETYTHQWDVRVREPYLNSIYMFGLGH